MTTDGNAIYSLNNILLQFETVQIQQLASSIALEATGRFALPYERIVRHRKMNRNGFESVWNFDVNIACPSLKYVMIVFNSAANFNRQTKKINTAFNPTKVDITLDGVPSKVYSQGMLPRHFFEEAYQVLSGSNREISAEANQILCEAGCSLIFTPYYFNGNSMPLIKDCRIVADGHIHSGGMELRNSGDGLQIAVTRTSSSGVIEVLIFVAIDVIAKFDGGRLDGVSW